MGNQNRKKISIEEAVDSLTSLSDLNLDVIGENSLGLEKHRSIEWLSHPGSQESEEGIAQVFKVVLKHLQLFYQKEYHYDSDPSALEDIKTIMVLVGNAAKKLDKYHQLFHLAHKESVTELKEYKKLQSFYKNHVAHKIDDEVLGKWLIFLTKKIQNAQNVGTEIQLRGVANYQTKHMFVDLESVKNDTDYELFLLRKEDGSRFFSPRLLRNIQLISDFGSRLVSDREDDLVLETEIYKDRMAHDNAASLVMLTHDAINKFYTATVNTNDKPLIAPFHKALMALMLAANPHNLAHQLPIKSCFDYFRDFQVFFRECLCSKTYQNIAAYLDNNASPVFSAMIHLIKELAKAFYLNLNGYISINSQIHYTIERSLNSTPVIDKKGELISHRLQREYQAMSKALKSYAHRPLQKTLEKTEEGGDCRFDPFLQDNLPSQVYSLHVQDVKFDFARWPSPTVQEYINKADVIEEFKTMLKASVEGKQNHKSLIFNFQDRTIWRDYCRCEAIESISEDLSVVTLTKDTEFYHQHTPYQQDSQAESFMHQLKLQLSDEMGGFYFSQDIQKMIIGDFLDESIKGIHLVFFSGKNVLSREQRENFIEIFYLFLQLKIIELTMPDQVAFTCKDGLDVSCTAATQLFVFLKMLSQEKLSEQDVEYCDLMLYGPSLVVRERVILKERFNRMISVLKVIESTRITLGYTDYVKTIQSVFGDLYDLPILEGKIFVKNK